MACRLGDQTLKKVAAQQISDGLLEASRLMNDVVSIAKEEATPEEFIAIRNAVGTAMGELLTEILNPLYYHYPDMKPEGLD